MSLPSALSAPQLANIRSDRYASRTYLALNPNAVVATARINQTVFGNSTAQLTFDNGSGTGDVLVGQTVLISRSNDPRLAYFRGRVRKAISGATLFINENSVSFADNDYIFILNDVALHTKLPRSDGGTFYMDYDITFRQMIPLISGLQSAYVITLDDTPEADLALTPSAIATTNGASISSWLWSAPDATFTVGNSTTQNVTLQWDTAGVYWVRLTVTDSGGRTNFMTFPVFVCSPDYSDSFIETAVENLSITANESGYQCSLSAFDGVEAVLDQTLAVVFSIETIGSQTTPIVSNVNFIGRLRNTTASTSADAQYVNIQDTTISIEDIGAQMARTPLLSYTFTDKPSPSVWGDIASLTIWRTLAFIMSEMSTLSNVCSILFDSTSTDFRIYDVNQVDNVLLDGLDNIADSINSRCTFSATGNIYLYRSARFLSTAQRNALTTVLNIQLQDMQSFSIESDPAKLIGRQITYGGSYNTSSQDTDIFQSVAPAVAPAEGVGQNETTNQVLTANQSLSASEIEIGTRVANDFEQRNPITKIDAVLHDSFHFIVPNNFQWYTFTIGTTDNNRGLEYTSITRWLCEEMTARYDNNIGSWDVNAKFAIETAGGNYQTVANIAPNQEGFYFDPYPIDDAYPFFPDENPFYPEENPPEDETPAIEPKDKQPIDNPVIPPNAPEIAKGGVVATWNSAGVWLTENFLTSDNPTWRLVYSGTGITQFKFAPLGNSGYVISNDGTDTVFARTTNIFAGSVVWNSIFLEGVYRQLRTTDTAGEVFVQSAIGDAWEETFDFTLDEYADEFDIFPPSVNIVTPVYTAGVGYNGGIHQPNTFRYNSVRIQTATFADTFITGFDIFYEITVNTVGALTDTSLQFKSGLNGSFSAVTTVPLGGSPISSSYTAVVNLTRDYYFWQINGARVASPTNPNANAIISKVVFRGTGANPFGGASAYNTRRSTDNGATFASAVSIGTSPASDAGFDTQRIGALVFAGADGKVRQATDGGTYSDTTNGATTGSYPRLIRSYGQAGTNLIIGSASSVSGETLWRVSGGSTAITPNDGVNDGLVVSANCLDMWITSNTNIVGIFNFGGVFKLGYSSDAGNSWTFVTSGITADSIYLRVKQDDTQRKQVYTIQASQTVYSSDGGATLQLKSSPSASLLGIEVK